MSRLTWHNAGDKIYETGVDQGVLYIVDQTTGAYQPGIAWNGISSIDENPTGGEPTAIWADNVKYLNLMSVEEFEGTINAYTYPEDFGFCDGSAQLGDNWGVSIGQQGRRPFGFSYRTLIGNELDDRLGYKIHLVYGATVSPSDKTRETVNDTPDANEFSWDFTTIPVPVTNAEGVEVGRPTAHIVIDSTKVGAANLTALENIIYGSGTGTTSSARLPLPAEILTVINGAG